MPRPKQVKVLEAYETARGDLALWCEADRVPVHFTFPAYSIAAVKMEHGLADFVATPETANPENWPAGTIVDTDPNAYDKAIQILIEKCLDIIQGGQMPIEDLTPAPRLSTLPADRAWAVMSRYRLARNDLKRTVQPRSSVPEKVRQLQEIRAEWVAIAAEQSRPNKPLNGMIGRVIEDQRGRNADRV